MTATAAGLQLYRPDFQSFDRRWPGLTDYPTPAPISHGQFLTTAMVGPHPSVQLRPYAGPKIATITRNGSWVNAFNLGSNVIVGMDFDSVGFAVSGGITFAHCYFHGKPATISYVQGTGPVSFVSCKADMSTFASTPVQKAPWNPTVLVESPPPWTFQWCLVQGCDKMTEIAPNMLIDSCMVAFINEWDAVNDQHQTGISAQNYSIINTVIRKCRLMCRHLSDTTQTTGISNCISHYNTTFHTGLTIEDNYLAGGGEYAFYGGGVNEKPSYHSRNLMVRRNIFGRDYSRHCGNTAVLFAFSQDPSAVWASTNVWGPPGPYFVTGDPAEGTSIAVAIDSTGVVRIAPSRTVSDSSPTTEHITTHR